MSAQPNDTMRFDLPTNTRKMQGEHNIPLFIY